MQALARTLPDKISSLSGVARDLSGATADFTRLQLDRAKDLSGALRQRLDGMVDRDTRKSLARLSRREIDQVKDLSGELQRQIKSVLGRDKRSSRLPLIVSVAVVGVAVGGTLLAIPRVRAGLRQGWDFVRGRRAGEAIRVAHGVDGAAWKPPHERQEDLLDEGIEESFPASDPVSVKRIT